MTRELKTRLHATPIEGGRRFIVSAAQSQMDFAIRAKRTGTRVDDQWRAPSDGAIRK